MGRRSTKHLDTRGAASAEKPGPSFKRVTQGKRSCPAAGMAWVPLGPAGCHRDQPGATGSGLVPLGPAWCQLDGRVLVPALALPVAAPACFLWPLNGTPCSCPWWLPLPMAHGLCNSPPGTGSCKVPTTAQARVPLLSQPRAGTSVSPRPSPGAVPFAALLAASFCLCWLLQMF